MPTGIGASIVNISNGTTANAPDVLNSLNSLNTNGVSNDGGLISTSGAGVLQPVGVTAKNQTITPQTQQSIANNGTISFTGSSIHVTSTAAVTGVIMQAGTADGQVCWLLNDGNFSLTFAASGSNVGSGSNNILNAGRAMIMMWNATTSLWENHGGN